MYQNVSSVFTREERPKRRTNTGHCSRRFSAPLLHCYNGPTSAGAWHPRVASIFCVSKRDGLCCCQKSAFLSRENGHFYIIYWQSNGKSTAVVDHPFESFWVAVHRFVHPFSIICHCELLDSWRLQFAQVRCPVPMCRVASVQSGSSIPGGRSMTGLVHD